MNALLLMLALVQDPTLDSSGWTVLTPSADSRIIHVSSSTGNDINSGTEAAPVATIQKAIKSLRSGFPDWILLKRGDSFLCNQKFEKSGRSESEPIVVSAYGDGSRPVINGSGFWYYSTTSPVGYSLNHIAICGIDFRASGLKQKGIDFGGGMSHILIEDNAFTGYTAGVHLHPWGDLTVPITDVAVRRNVVKDQKENGVLISGIDRLTLDENIFDYNGYGAGYGTDPGVEGPTIFKHNAYIGAIKNFVCRGNIFARGSNFGLKMATNEFDSFNDFTVENNLFFNNGITMSNSGGLPAGIDQFRFNRGFVRSNVFTELGRTFVGGGGSQDLAAYLTNTNAVVWDGNYFVHKPYLVGNPTVHWGNDDRHLDITIRNSVVYDWDIRSTDGKRYFELNAYNPYPATPGVTNLQLIENEIDQAAGLYLDPSRTVGSYYASIGGTNDAAAFLAEARGMSKASWNQAYTANAVNDYIRDGFANLIPIPNPDLDPVRTRKQQIDSAVKILIDLNATVEEIRAAETP